MSGEIAKVSNDKHDGDIISLAFNNGFIFTGGADGKLKVWDTDLNLLNSLEFEAYIYSIAVTPQNKVYASCCDGAVRFSQNPDSSPEVQELFRCDDTIQAMVYADECLYTGDDKGVVAKWHKDKIVLKYSLVEEVKSLAVEKMLIYTARDLDVVISEMVPGKSGKYTNRAVVPGKSPLTLIGVTKDGNKELLAFPDRSGKGVIMVKNLPGQKFATLWTVEDHHEAIINGICGSDTSVYTGGYDSKVKCLTNILTDKPKDLGGVDTGSCVNAIALGEDPSTVYAGSADGVLRKIIFNLQK